MNHKDLDTHVVFGKRYKDLVTGFEGIASAIYCYINGCVRIELSGASKSDDDPKSLVVDHQMLELVDNGISDKLKPVGRTGGPQSSKPVPR